MTDDAGRQSEQRTQPDTPMGKQSQQQSAHHLQAAIPASGDDVAAEETAEETSANPLEKSPHPIPGGPINQEATPEDERLEYWRYPQAEGVAYVEHVAGEYIVRTATGEIVASLGDAGQAFRVLHLVEAESTRVSKETALTTTADGAREPEHLPTMITARQKPPREIWAIVASIVVATLIVAMFACQGRTTISSANPPSYSLPSTAPNPVYDTKLPNGFATWEADRQRMQEQQRQQQVQDELKKACEARGGRWQFLGGCTK